jgi:hypothetical protein
VDNVRAHVLSDHPWLAADPALAPWQEPADLDVVQTGAWILPDERPLPAELEAFLDAGTPPVYVGFGSMRTPKDIARVAIDWSRAPETTRAWLSITAIMLAKPGWIAALMAWASRSSAVLARLAPSSRRSISCHSLHAGQGYSGRPRCRLAMSLSMSNRPRPRWACGHASWQGTLRRVSRPFQKLRTCSRMSSVSWWSMNGG